MKVKFVDLHAMHAPLMDEFRQVFERVLENSSFVLGAEVSRFEEAFAKYLGAGHCIAVTNGTVALELALLAMGVGPGDEVITVPNTFIATAEAVSAVGARPVFVDVDPVSYNMDPTLVERAITPRTRVLLPVHLYGQPADMDPLLEIAARHGLKVLEDACQAHGAEYKGKKAGSMGAAGCFSFYPGKNLGALGEGGAVVTNDPELAAKMKVLRDHGSLRKYEHAVPGYNFRLEGLQGGFLAVKLPHLDSWNDRRRRRPSIMTICSPATASSLPSRCPTRTTCIISTSSRRTIASSCARISTPRASRPACTIPARCICRKPTSRSATTREISRSASVWRTASSRCPCSRISAASRWNS